MSPGRISNRVVVDRLDWIAKMINEIDSLPVDNFDKFIKDKRNIWTAESCLRRSIEALMDLGRHILAKAFSSGVSEYKEIAVGLEKNGVLNQQEGEIFRILAGYRNRLVHFYYEITEKELFEICSSQLSDIDIMIKAIKKWVREHPEFVENAL